MAKQLIINGLQFEKAVKKLEKFWKVWPGSVCMRCYKIGYKCLSYCGNRLEKCIICTRKHQIIEHQCGIRECSKKIEKLCIYVVV